MQRLGQVQRIQYQTTCIFDMAHLLQNFTSCSLSVENIALFLYTKLVSSSFSVKLFMIVKNLYCMTGILHNRENYCIYAPFEQGYLTVMYLSVCLYFVNYLSAIISCLTTTYLSVYLSVCLLSIFPVSVLVLLIVIKTKKICVYICTHKIVLFI